MAARCILELSELALNVRPKRKVQAHRKAILLVVKRLGRFWQSQGKSIARKSSGGPSDFLAFVAQSMEIITYGGKYTAKAISRAIADTRSS